jgi:glycosyltransferase involved in cell wall biosynthesis
MRICYLSLGFMPAIRLGGSIRSAYYLTRTLSERGHRVTVCCTNLASKSEKLFSGTRRTSYDGVEVIYFNTYKLPLGRDSFGAYFCPGMVRFFREELCAYDIVHMDGYREFPVLVASHFCRRFDIPYVIQARGSIRPAYASVLAKRSFDRLLGPKILQNCGIFVASSEAEEADYRKVIPGRSKILRINNGIDLEEFSRLPEKGRFRRRYGIGEDLLITYLGRLHPLKGIDFLIQAFAIGQANGNRRLAIIGPDEDYKHFLLAMVKDKGLSDSVTFLGALEGTEKLEAYVDSDVIVYAGKSESFGMVALEALLCGVPVISSEETGCGQLLDGLGAGFLVRYGDSRHLAETIDNVLNNYGAVQKRVRKAVERIKVDFTWKNIAEKYEIAYSSLLRGRTSNEHAVDTPLTRV